jgi:hypothetical protein
VSQLSVPHPNTGPDERPKIAVDKHGSIAVAFAIFKDSAFNGQVFYTPSSERRLDRSPGSLKVCARSVVRSRRVWPMVEEELRS